MPKRVKTTTTMATPVYTWATSAPVTPFEVDDQAPIPLIVGIALALFLGFVVIVCCMCRRRSLMDSSSSSSNNQNNADYQRAPTGDGAGQGAGFNGGMGVGLVWATSAPVTPFEVDDQAPIPLIVGIALALFLGFVVIVCCMCRRRSLMDSSSSSSNNQNNADYQRAPTGDGAGQGAGFNGGMGTNSYPMTAVNTMHTANQGQQGMAGQNNSHGGMNMGQPGQAHPYPSLPSNAYTPPYPIGYGPLPSYMPTSQSSHASSNSGPSSEHAGPSGFSSSPPAPAPAPTGMMAGSGNASTSDQSQTYSRPSESEGVESSAATTSTGVGTLGSNYSSQYGGQGQYQGYQGQGHFGGQGQGPYGSQGQGQYGPQGQGQYGHQGQLQYGVQGQTQAQYGVQGQGQYGGQGQFSAYHMGQRGMGMGGATGYMPQGGEKGGQGGGPTHMAMHTTAMDYMPGSGFGQRVGSPMPFAAGPDTTVTELDQL